MWEEITDEYGLKIGNVNWPTHHSTRNRAKGESNLDVTLANRLITSWTTPDVRHAPGRDQEVFDRQFRVKKQVESDHVRSNQASRSKENEEAEEKHWKELEAERAHLEEECTGDKVGREAEWCQEVLRKVLDTNAKKIRIRTRSKRWWNRKSRTGGAHCGERRGRNGCQKRQGA